MNAARVSFTLGPYVSDPFVTTSINSVLHQSKHSVHIISFIATLKWQADVMFPGEEIHTGLDET